MRIASFGFELCRRSKNIVGVHSNWGTPLALMRRQTISAKAMPGFSENQRLRKLLKIELYLYGQSGCIRVAGN